MGPTFLNIDSLISELNLSTFISPEGQWNLDMLHDIFPADMITLILRIPIAMGNWSD